MISFPNIFNLEIKEWKILKILLLVAWGSGGPMPSTTRRPSGACTIWRALLLLRDISWMTLPVWNKFCRKINSFIEYKMEYRIHNVFIWRPLCKNQITLLIYFMQVMSFCIEVFTCIWHHTTTEIKAKQIKAQKCKEMNWNEY